MEKKVKKLISNITIGHDSLYKNKKKVKLILKKKGKNGPHNK